SNFWDPIESFKSDFNRKIYLLGVFAGEIDIEPGAGTSLLNSSTTGTGFPQGVLFGKLDNDGSLMWAESVKNSGSYMEGCSHAIDIYGNFYHSGYISEDSDFGVNGDTEIIATNNTSPFLAKYGISTSGLVEEETAIEINVFPNP